MTHATEVKKNIKWLKETCFNDPDRQIILEKGHKLLRPGQKNDRLFLVLEGTLVGYIENPGGNRFEIFRSGENNLVGAYSFFSDKHQSYSTVQADERTLTAYVRQEDLHGPGRDYGEFARRILPVVVDEIYSRQLMAHQMSIEKQETLKRLMQAEKLATLGQMAAGLAHELNNALGVIQKKTDWLITRISNYVSAHDSRELYKLFERGLHSGQPLASTEVRQRRRKLEKQFQVHPNVAKSLAKMGLSPADVAALEADDLVKAADQMNYYYETGLALHDMRLAAGHASEVVQSVHDLGVVHRRRPVPVSLNSTLREASSLLKDLLKPVELTMALQEIPSITANSGDWVQVWVNLLKNALEALQLSETPKPHIHIESHQANSQIEVTITDNGPGIPESILDKIYEPSFTTKKDGLTFGLGLGLSIVQKIIETYQGKIEVESRPGRTTFRVTVPLQ